MLLCVVVEQGSHVWLNQQQLPTAHTSSSSIPTADLEATTGGGMMLSEKATVLNTKFENISSVPVVSGTADKIGDLAGEGGTLSASQVNRYSTKSINLHIVPFFFYH